MPGTGNHCPGRDGVVRAAVMISAGMVMLVIGAAPAPANMRAPMVRPAPSSALMGPAPGLSVVSARVEFDCDRTCRVRAVYRCRAEVGGRYGFRFVLPRFGPRPRGLTARVGQALSPVRLVNLPRPNRRLPWDRGRMVLAAMALEAHFDGVFKAGLNRIEVSYVQPYGVIDLRPVQGRGGWKLVHSLTYEVWPIKEWRLDPGFRFVVRLFRMVPRPRQTIDNGWTNAPDTTFEDRYVVVFRSRSRDGSDPRLLTPRITTGPGGRRVYELAYGNPVPDRLECFFGPARYLTGRTDF